MEIGSTSRQDSITGAGFLMGLSSAVLLLVGEFFGLPDALWGLGIAMFVLGLLLVAAGTGMATRSSGTGWRRSLVRGLRAAVGFLVDFLP